MRRSPILILAAVLALLCTLTNTASNAFGSEKPRKSKSDDKFIIKAVPVGPTEDDVNAAIRRIGMADAFSSSVKGAKYRLIKFEFLNRDSDQAAALPSRFRATFYNYSRDLAVIAEGDFAGGEPIQVFEMSADPGANGDEVEAAMDLVRKDARYRDLNAANKLEIYEAMPPVSNLNGERLVNVGVRNLETGENQIVGISFKNDSIVFYPDNAPPTARATPEACGVPNAGQGSTGRGLAGTLAVTAFETGNTNPVWEMTVLRPSASTGGEGSGIEIRDVKYRGKSVLKRAHLPVLNVKYVNSCGPFRDWQYAEGYFQIPSSGVNFPNGPSGGFAVIDPPGIATTIIESRNDTGNFRGVAIYQQDPGTGNELVLVTEMDAGWYRYIMEWRFGFDGRIRPRFGFGSAGPNSCICIQRNHHAYWRFDFDIVQPQNNIYLVERGKKFLTPIRTETAFFRNYARNRSFVIQNANGNEAYSITPNLTDSTVTDANGVLIDTFGKGDFWLLRFQGTAANPGELDDPNTDSSINLAPWLNGESLVGQDVVIWYGAHQTRVDDASLSLSGQIIRGVHVIGPDLRPIRW